MSFCNMYLLDAKFVKVLIMGIMPCFHTRETLNKSQLFCGLSSVQIQGMF